MNLMKTSNRAWTLTSSEPRHSILSFIDAGLRAAPLGRVNVKFTAKNAACNGLGTESTRKRGV